MNLQKRIESFKNLGSILSNLSSTELENLALDAQNNNTWFTPTSVKLAIEGIGKFLDKTVLENWCAKYHLPDSPKEVKIIGVVMAGNIPLVGFHDLLCVLISGYRIKIKLSSQDAPLMKYVCKTLSGIDPYFSDCIEISDQLKDVDAIIATGSDNTSRYFEFYFAKYPHIIRKNRTSIAILSGDEMQEDLYALGKDIFTFYGLGCRNVSKLYVPKNYKFDKFFEAIEEYSPITQHHKYSNNYDYNKSIYLINGVKHLDNGFLMVTEREELVSPISVLYFEYYNSEEELGAMLKTNTEKIQCIVSKEGNWENSFAFGLAQSPSINDYADNVDTMAFLKEL
ncbi:MAG TPA: acyl-CoA reductase [Fulvivirga sp.]|nr:acyl-CoA reductase [Fulvivirga sp.]